MKHTPLHDIHADLGAKIVDFAGFEMPVWYEGIVAEHDAVRSSVGLFDVSHMGEFVVHGPEAQNNLRRVLTNDVTLLEDGQAHYSLITNERGGTVDDLLVYRLSDAVFLLVVNASNIGKDRDWLESQLTGEVTLDDVSDGKALLAVQGPRAPTVLAETTRMAVWTMKYYRFERGEVAGVQALVSRTGYTGEDGFEIMVDAEDAVPVWTALMQAGEPHGIRPAGLGARDSLRLEASMPLYGHELDDDTSALEAGLGFAVKLDKPDMIGMDRLVREKADGVSKKLIGFEMIGRGIPRQGYPIMVDGKVVGEVTSGTQAPTIDRAVGMGYVPPAIAAIDTDLTIDARGREVAARVVKRPFYKRDRSK